MLDSWSNGAWHWRSTSRSWQCAHNWYTSPQDLLNGVIEILRHGARPHHPRNIKDSIVGDVPVMLIVLCIFSISLVFLKCLDDQCARMKGTITTFAYLVVHGELHRRCFLHYVLSYLLRSEYQMVVFLGLQLWWLGVLSFGLKNMSMN